MPLKKGRNTIMPNSEFYIDPDDIAANYLDSLATNAEEIAEGEKVLWYSYSYELIEYVMDNYFPIKRDDGSIISKEDLYSLSEDEIMTLAYKCCCIIDNCDISDYRNYHNG